MSGELSYHYVAFLDILGFEEMVHHDCGKPASQSSYLPKLIRAHKRALECARRRAGAKVTQFSDSIALALPYSKTDFIGIVELVAELQRHLLDDFVLCRGGLSYGKHYSEDEFVFSHALIQAYRIERDRAVYPRVVVDDDLLDLVKPFEAARGPTLIREADGACFVDYLHGMNATAVQRAVDGSTKGWERAAVRVREKLRWLREYAGYKFPQEIGFTNSRFAPESGLSHGDKKSLEAVGP